MKFNQDKLSEIKALFNEFGFSLQEESELHVRFESKHVLIVFSHNPRENSNTLWVKGKHTHEIEIDNRLMKDFFDSDIKISELPIDTFLANLFMFFKEDGNDLLKSSESVISNLANYSEQRSNKYTEELIDKQYLEAAQKAWQNRNYHDFIIQLKKVSEEKLTPSLIQKLKIAQSKI